MPSKKIYNLLLLLLPIIYFFHNLEEWIVFRIKALIIIPLIPNNIRTILPKSEEGLILVFGIAILFATIIPIILSAFLWGKFTSFKAKLLMIIAFVTLINTFSHITSSIVLGFISPGLITGIFLCIPYAFGIVFFITNSSTISPKQFFLLGLTSIAVFIFGILLLWLLAIIITSF
jgi:hypothetical protein